jgi:hypothetical protein
MSTAVFRLLKRGALKISRWGILLLPICFTGCFESQSANRAGKQSAGIASMMRYFSFGQQATPDKATDASGLSQNAWFPRFTEIPDLSGEEQELATAMPSFLGAGGDASKNPFSVKSIGQGLTAQKRSANASAASALFSNSFSQFFAAVFKQKTELSTNQADKEETPNPFTEAKQKLESSTTTAAENKTTGSGKSSTSQTSSSQETKQVSTDGASGAGISPGEAVLIVGDFAGTGIVSAITARRSGDASFLADDGERSFSLVVNTDAVRQRSAFCVEDINGDGAADILITNSGFLFGGILLGDGNGGYASGGSFPTWYRAMVPTTGPARNGMRDIVAVDMQSGFVARYIAQQPQRYRFAETAELSFTPNYLLHLVATDTSRDFFMSAQVGGMEKIVGWSDDDHLTTTANTLGADPNVATFSLESNTLQAYQVGSYFSLLLSQNGKSFNVANVRMLPRIFVVVGDIYRNGTLDVAVGSLSVFSPKKK